MDAKGLVESAVQKLFLRDANFPDGVNERTILGRSHAQRSTVHDRVKLVLYRRQLGYAHAFLVCLDMADQHYSIEIPCEGIHADDPYSACLLEHGHRDQHSWA